MAKKDVIEAMGTVVDAAKKNEQKTKTRLGPHWAPACLQSSTGPGGAQEQPEQGAEPHSPK